MSRLKTKNEIKYLSWLNLGLKPFTEKTKRLMKSFKNLREKISKVNHIFRCLISLLNERQMDVLRSKWLILSLMIQVQGLYIVLQGSVRKITRCVFPRVSYIPMTLQYRSMKMVNLQTNVLPIKIFMLKRPIK